VYKGCTPDAPRMPTGFYPVHPVSTPRTPNVHPLYTVLLCRGQSWGWGALGMGGKRCFWPVLGGVGQVKARSWPCPILAFSLSLPVRSPSQAGWLNHIEIYFSIIPSKVLPPNDFNSRARLADRLEPFEGHYAINAQPCDWRVELQTLRVAVHPQ